MEEINFFLSTAVQQTLKSAKQANNYIIDTIKLIMSLITHDGVKELRNRLGSCVPMKGIMSEINVCEVWLRDEFN